MDADIKAVLDEREADNPLLPFLYAYFERFEWDKSRNAWRIKAKL